jgi:hypothetical protein
VGKRKKNKKKKEKKIKETRKIKGKTESFLLGSAFLLRIGRAYGHGKKRG